jgi:hypothetical protein
MPHEGAALKVEVTVEGATDVALFESFFEDGARYAVELIDRS